MRLIDNISYYINDLNILEKTFFKMNFFKETMDIVNIVPLFVLIWVSFMFFTNIIFKKNIHSIIGLFLSLLISGMFYSYLSTIKDNTYQKIKNNKIYSCALIDSKHFYISDEQFKCLRTKLSNDELNNKELSFIENTFITNKNEIYKDLQKDITYNYAFILIVFIIVYIISLSLVTMLFGKYDKRKTTLVNGTETNPRDYQLFMLVATILYLLSINFLNSDNINNKRLNYKILERNNEQLIEEKKVEIKNPIEYDLLKSSIKDNYKYKNIISGKIDKILDLKLEDLNIDNFKSFMNNKEIENSYFTNILKYGFYENKNLALDNKEKQSLYYVNKANSILTNDIKNNDGKLIKTSLDFFGYYDNVKFDNLISNRQIKDLETNFYLDSVSRYKLNYCEAINANIKIDFVDKSYSKKDIQEIIRISEKYNCYNKYRTLKL